MMPFSGMKIIFSCKLKTEVGLLENELRDHPHKATILNWIQGVKLEEFLNSCTKSEYQGIHLDFHYPNSLELQTYVPSQFDKFMDDQVQEWLHLGVMKYGRM